MSFKWVPNALTIMRCFGAFVVGWVILRYGMVVDEFVATSEPAMALARDDILALSGPNAGPSQETLDAIMDQLRAVYWFSVWPFILFVLVAASDFLDGYFARKLNAVSAFGAFLDPVADKLLVAVSLIAVAYVLDWYWIILLPAIVIIARDSYVTLLRLRPNVKLPVSKLAKYKTALEMAGIGGLLLAWAVPGLIGSSAPDAHTESYINAATMPMELLWFASFALIYLAAALSAYTGWLYVRSAMAKV